MLIMHINEYNKTYTDAAKIRLDLVKCCNIRLFERFKFEKKEELFIYKKDSQFSVWGSLFITYYLLNLLILFKSLK